MRKSHCDVNSTPTPTAAPFTAAMVGFMIEANVQGAGRVSS
jgi:hypothetical protein